MECKLVVLTRLWATEILGENSFNRKLSLKNFIFPRFFNMADLATKTRYILNLKWRLDDARTA